MSNFHKKVKRLGRRIDYFIAGLLLAIFVFVILDFELAVNMIGTALFVLFIVRLSLPADHE